MQTALKHYSDFLETSAQLVAGDSMSCKPYANPCLPFVVLCRHLFSQPLFWASLAEGSPFRKLAAAIVCQTLCLLQTLFSTHGHLLPVQASPEALFEASLAEGLPFKVKAAMTDASGFHTEGELLELEFR